ncbi:Sensor histidine kinase OS=Streptomyces cyaneofuscatus OX=66883 GN=G3I52_21180 PE=4 SV=1 [Streptomyces cyaneofuscatus]
MTSPPRRFPSVPGPAAPVTAEQRWEQFYRYGPYAVLTLSVLVGAVAADLIMTRTEMYAAGALAAPRTGSRSGGAGPARVPLREPRPERPTTSPPPRLRPVLAQPVLRHLRAQLLRRRTPLPKRFVRAGLLTTAVTLAGSQSGGLPRLPDELGRLAALYVLNATLGLFFWQVGLREEETARVQAATIAELERTNLRLEAAMAENAALHAQLLVQAREAGVDDERRQLAAEIHDTLAQGLTGIIAQLQVVTSLTDRNRKPPASTWSGPPPSPATASARPAAPSTTWPPPPWSTTN